MAATTSPLIANLAMEAQTLPSRPTVELNAVTVTYQGVTVLDRVSLTVPSGEFLALLGPNGSGKTTLLKVVAGLIVPDEGTARVLGAPPASMGKGRQRIGYLPQSNALNPRFPITGRQVVMMARYASIGPGRFPRQADQQAVQAALDRTEALDFADHPIGKLSGGQRQRVFLARALVNRPSLLLLDEPSTAMDTDSEVQLYRTLREMHDAGTTILIASHDIGVISTYVDRVACLNRKLVAHGRPGTVMTEEVMQEMYGCDSMLFGHGHPHMVVKRHP
jgi:zinc transport system ATP-binding protein